METRDSVLNPATTCAPQHLGDTNCASQQLGNTKHAPQQLGDVLILGLGKSGSAVARYLAPHIGGRVKSLTVIASNSNDASRALADELRAAGAVVRLDCTQVEGSFNVCIASPGISQFSDLYVAAQAASGAVISEVEFAWSESAADSRWVAVTGTNGKTTTTALVAHVLQAAGFNARAVGNIGDTCIDAVAAGNTDVYEAETSSYQLASTRDFAPNVAVILNITPDHLSWHTSFENYRDAKFKVLQNLAHVEGGAAVLDATDTHVRTMLKQLRSQAEGAGFPCNAVGTADSLASDMRTRCGSENAAFLADSSEIAEDIQPDNPMLTVAFNGHEHALVRSDELQIQGIHNAANALAAASAALALGASPEAVRDGLRSFQPLEHRIEPCGSVRGIPCYNDSKATNVDATLVALAAFGAAKPVVLLGGDDKGTALDTLVAAAEAHCRAVVCFGAAGERFYEAFEGAKVPRLRAEWLADALDTALENALPGDVVLLSPACASFDEFSCFEERSEGSNRLLAPRAAACQADEAASLVDEAACQTDVVARQTSATTHQADAETSQIDAASCQIGATPPPGTSSEGH